MVTERLLAIADKTVQYAVRQNVDQVQASAFLLDTALTRFANSQIHQNVATKKGAVFIKTVLNKQVSTTRVNTLEKEQIQRAVIQAVKIAKASPPNKDFRSLPEPEQWTPIGRAFDEETANCTPRYRAEKVKEAIETAHSKSPNVKAVAGYFFTGLMAYAVSNSLGISAWAKISSADMKTTVMSKSGNSEGSGTAEEYSRRVSEIEPASLAQDAAEKSVKSINPTKLSPSEYQVVLSPLASATLLMYVGYVGFSATSYQDGQSFVRYCLNQQVFDGKLDVKDDARDPRTLYATPIDGEGVPKTSMQLISKGIVSEQSICHNSYTAAKEGKKSTGHALPPISDYYSQRPMPFNLIVSPGDATLKEEIAETKRGIFITTFHYVNPVEPTKMVLTGLTRDGTFMIENGEISKPIVNMRFTDSMLSALKNIPMIGKQLKIVEQTTVPSMKLEKLRFVGLSAY
jgi:PmbA protein